MNVPARFQRRYGDTAADEYMATAMHEAAHGIVTLLCNRKFRYVTLRPRDDVAGHVVSYPTNYIRPLDMIIGAAGYVAETMICHGDTPELSGFLGHGNSRGDVAVWNEIADTFPDLDPEEEFSFAVDHVDAYSWEIVRLADMLTTKHTVTGREAARLLGVAV